VALRRLGLGLRRGGQGEDFDISKGVKRDAIEINYRGKKRKIVRKSGSGK